MRKVQAAGRKDTFQYRRMLYLLAQGYGVTVLIDVAEWKVATPTRFELAISALTGPYVKPLHHGAAKT